MTLTELSTIVGLVIALTGFIGMLAYNILKGRFVTHEDCEKKQGACRQQTCHKIEAVKTQVTIISSEIKEGRDISEKKRDIARREYTEQIEKVFHVIEETEKRRADQLEKMHTFMGQVTADLDYLKRKVG